MTSPDLDQLLVAAARSGSPADDVRFTHALLEATVGCLLVRTAEGRVSPVTIPVEDGPAVPFFSTPDKAREAQRVIERPGVVEQGIAARELFAMAVRNNGWLVLNPFSPYGRTFSPAELSDLLAGVERGARSRTVGADTTWLVGEPAHVADGLAEGLRDHLAGLGGVDSASLAWVEYPDGLQGYLLVVRTALPRPTVLAGIDGPASRTDGRTIDILVVPPGGNDPASRVPPFYSRT